MKNILDNLKREDLANAREIIYFILKQLKQAECIDDYEKNIFNDYLEFAPTEYIKSSTRKYLAEIERFEGRSAKEFDGETYTKWIKELEKIDEHLDPKPGPDIEEKAQKFLDSF